MLSSKTLIKKLSKQALLPTANSMAEDSVTEIEEISRTSPLESPRLALGRTSRAPAAAYFDSVDTPKNDEVMRPFICKRVLCV